MEQFLVFTGENNLVMNSSATYPFIHFYLNCAMFQTWQKTGASLLDADM